MGEEAKQRAGSGWGGDYKLASMQQQLHANLRTSVIFVMQCNFDAMQCDFDAMKATRTATYAHSVYYRSK